jgi:hypothetical protein
MRTMILAALFAAATAAPALADTVWTATPAQPSNQAGLAAGNVIWNCDKTGCATNSDTTVGDDKQACRELAQAIGPLSAFTSSHPYTPEALDKCNKWGRR